MGARTRLRGSDCFPIELVPPPPANAGRGAANLLDLVRPLSDCIEKRLVGWSEIARTGRVRYAAHRGWLTVDTRDAGARPGRRGGARRCRTGLVRALSGGTTCDHSWNNPVAFTPCATKWLQPSGNGCGLSHSRPTLPLAPSAWKYCAAACIDSRRGDNPRNCHSRRRIGVRPAQAWGRG